MKEFRAVRDLVEYIPFRLIIGALRLLPLQTSRKIVLFLFDKIGYGAGIRRKVAEQQLGNVFPDLSAAGKKRIIRNVYRNLALNVVTAFLIPDDKLMEMFSFENLQNLEEALQLGKGVLLVAGHFGDWEAACRILPMKGFGMAIIVKKQHNLLFDKFTNSIRERRGGRIIYMKNALRGVLGHLKQNHLIGILIDQDAGRRGILGDFLGKPASLWKGAAKIALRYQIPLVPAFVIRNPNDSLTFTFDKMINPEGLADDEINLISLIKEANAALETKIRKYPDQWFWLHKRWKSAKFFLKD